MGKKGSSSKVEEREGNNLLGKPKFKKIEGKDRYRCVETGHEVPNNEEAKAAYSLTKHCRIGLIDSSLSKNKPPLNIFRQHPTCRLKLICQLTGDTINKSEQHIWKHINGKRFLNMLEKKEAEKETGSETVGDKPKEDHVKEKRKKKKEKKKNKKGEGEGEETKKEEDSDIGKHNSETINSSAKECDSEIGDFWEPPVGERWDMDDGGERWSSGSDSDSDAEFKHDDDVANEADDAVDDESKEEARELSIRTKRMAIEMEPSSLASRKKKKKKKNEAPE